MRTILAPSQAVNHRMKVTVLSAKQVALPVERRAITTQSLLQSRVRQQSVSGGGQRLKLSLKRFSCIRSFGYPDA
mgnify:CR=1